MRTKTFIHLLEIELNIYVNKQFRMVRMPKKLVKNILKYHSIGYIIKRTYLSDEPKNIGWHKILCDYDVNVKTDDLNNWRISLVKKRLKEK